MIFKVNGLREPENIRDVCDLGVDWIGFDFWEDSPRYVKQVSSRGGFIPDYTSIQDERPRLGPPVKRDINQVNHPKRIGVFVDEMPQTIVTRVYNFCLDFVQLDGDESHVMIENLRRTVEPDIRKGVQIIKKISLSTVADLERCNEFAGVVDYFLFEVSKQDRDVLAAYHGNVPFILGGVDADDAEWLKTYNHPMLAGVHLNESFEVEPGVKDVESLKKFMETVKA